MKLLRVLGPALLTALAPLPAGAAPLVVTGSRVELAEVVPDAPEAARDVDLGPAPPPGASALLDRERVLGSLRSAGVDPSQVRLPRVLRVVAASEKRSPAELAELLRPSVEAALPRGVSLLGVNVKAPLVSAPGAVAARAEIPKMPRRAGPWKTAVVVPLVADGAVVARVTATVSLDVSPIAARPDVLRGSRITLFIDRAAARIGAAGISLEDADIGEVASFRVEKTGRTVRARIESTDLASVVAP
jgi:hypothetical protein